MRIRVAGIWKHPKSGIYWFRMAVPERHRVAMGKREVKETLRTRSEIQARLKHAAKLTEVTSLFARLDLEENGSARDEAKGICLRGIEALARRNFSKHDDGVTTLVDAENNVVSGMLTLLAFRVRCTWGEDHRIRAEHHLLGDSDEEAKPAMPAVAVTDPQEQDRMVELIETLEGRFVPLPDENGRESSVFCSSRKTHGLVNREIAASLLQRRDWKFVELEVMVVAEAANAPLQIGTKLYDSLAEEILTKLANYRRDKATAFDLIVRESFQPSIRSQNVTASASTSGDQKTLRDAFEQWCRNNGINLDGNGQPDPPNKTADEWNLARRRMDDLFGPICLRHITAEMAHKFRDVLAGLPSRPKAEIKRLALRDQVLAAKKLKLKTLNPNSVKKQVTAVQTMLGAAKAVEWIDINVALEVTVAGAGHFGDERDFFTLEELRMIFSSPLMTDPAACNDSMFFIVLLETLHGGRPGELAKLMPNDIGIFDNVSTLRIRRTEGRKQKSRSSVRDIPLHQICVEAGILELAELRRRENAKWLFSDLEPDKYGDRYKFLSRKINRELRALGIEAPDKSFYSARHAHKRESRRQGIPEEHSDQLSGHTTPGSGRNYGKGVPIETLKRNVDRVTYNLVDWAPVIQCARVRIGRLKKMEDKQLTTHLKRKA